MQANFVFRNLPVRERMGEYIFGARSLGGGRIPHLC